MYGWRHRASDSRVDITVHGPRSTRRRQCERKRESVSYRNLRIPCRILRISPNGGFAAGAYACAEEIKNDLKGFSTR